MPRSAEPQPAQRNVISGNGGDGVFVIGSSCLVEGNLIGTNAAGTAAVANTDYGVHVAGPGATIGGTSAGAGNVISGNGGNGVYLDSSSILVEGNLIGTDAAGTAALATAARRASQLRRHEQHDRRDLRRRTERHLRQPWRRHRRLGSAAWSRAT